MVVSSDESETERGAKDDGRAEGAQDVPAC